MVVNVIKTFMSMKPSATWVYKKYYFTLYNTKYGYIKWLHK